jgi:hypothetical protein
MQQRLKIEVGWTRFHSSHDGVAGSDLIDPCVCVARGQRSAFFAALPRDGCRVVALSIIVMAKRRRRLDGSMGDYESPYGSRLDAGLAVMAVLAGALCVAGQPSTSLLKRVTLPTSLLFDLPDQPPNPCT